MKPARILVYLVGSLCLALALALVVTRDDDPVVRSAEVVVPVGVDRSTCPSGTGARVTCVSLDVPEDYNDPEIAQVSLFAARIEPPFDPIGSPLLFIGAGMGEVAVGDLIAWQQLTRDLEREVILLDLRGVGSSEPRLGCADAFRAEWLQSELDTEDLDDLKQANADDLTTCRSRLERDHPLEAYTLDAFASDIDQVRERLGVEQWTIAAGGRATDVARRAEELFPDRVESLVLLGAAHASDDPQADRYRYAVEVYEETIDEGVRASLERITQRLENQSIVFPVQVRGRTERVLVSDESVLPTITKALEDPEFRTGLPTFVTGRLGEGEWRSIALLRGAQRGELFGRSTPVAVAVACSVPGSEQADVTWLEAEGFDSRWTSLLDDPIMVPGVCEAWEVVSPGEPIGAPSSQTLVINGRYDVDAPSSAAAVIDEAWNQATTVVLPEAARPSLLDACVISLVTDFLSGDDPTLGSEC
ncbi:MAG: alpha/beta fold hydrolase [Ilumatobacter sp.]